MILMMAIIGVVALLAIATTSCIEQDVREEQRRVERNRARLKRFLATGE